MYEINDGLPRCFDGYIRYDLANSVCDIYLMNYVTSLYAPYICKNVWYTIQLSNHCDSICYCDSLNLVTVVIVDCMTI